MALKVADRVKQTTLSTGVGGISLSGSVDGFQDFSDALSDNDTTFYVIEENDEFEVGLGTYGSNSLSRDIVFSSSNGDSKLSLGGSGVVSVTYPADRSVFKNSDEHTVASSGILFSDSSVLKPASGSLYWQNTNIGLAYAAGSGLTLVDHEFNVFGGSGHFINLEVTGAFTAETKSFLIDHPTKEGMKLQYGSLEGPENGVYVRGIASGNVIELPDYWPELIDKDTVTVNLTPQSHPQPNLFVKTHDDTKVVIESDRPIMTHYIVFAERKDVPKLEVEHES
jgi:hypothetical protein